MPSTSLIPSQTAVSIHILPSPHEANPGEPSVSHRRMSFLRQMNGLWKGKQYLTAAGRELIVDSKVLHPAQRSRRQAIACCPRLRPPAGRTQRSYRNPRRPHLILHSLPHLLRSRHPFLFLATTKMLVGPGSQFQAPRRGMCPSVPRRACTLICPMQAAPSLSRAHARGMYRFPRIPDCPTWPRRRHHPW